MNLPFTSIALNEGQQTGLNKIIDWLSDPSSPRVFRLKGRAGTGKSLLVASMYEEIEAVNQALSLFKLPFQDIQLTATTNQAADELSQKITKADVRVIHSYLSLTVHDYNGETHLAQRKNTSVFDLVPYNVRIGKDNLVIVIDEASYVGKDLNNYLNLLLEAHKNIKIMFVYDHKQLLPVGETTCVIDELYDESDSIVHELTENERFLSFSNSAIAVAADAICNTISDDSLEIPDIEEGEDLQFITTDEALDIALNHFKEAEYRWNPNHMLYVAHTNKNVVEANEILYTELVGDRHPLSVSGIHLTNNSMYSPLGKSAPPTLRNNQKVTIASSPRELKPLVIAGVDVVSVLVYPSSKKISDPIYVNVAFNSSQYLSAIASAKRLANWTVYYELKESIADLRLSYASTVYKAQGKSCNYVMVDIQDILEKSSTLDEAKRLLYVAITRAKKKVYLIWN